jgi:hypothetical protein
VVAVVIMIASSEPVLSVKSLHANLGLGAAS